MVLRGEVVLQDNLYVRVLYRNVPEDVPREFAFIGTVNVPRVAGIIVHEEKPTRYLTRMTIQGDNLGSSMGVFADESVYIEGAFPHLRFCLFF